MNYKNKAHENVFKKYVEKCTLKLPNRTLACIYVLSADKNTWKRAKDCIEKKEINFKNISLKDTSNYEYLLIKVANDIYDMNVVSLALYDISDKNLVSDKTFEIISEALKIARRGYEVLDLEKEFN